MNELEFKIMEDDLKQRILDFGVRHLGLPAEAFERSNILFEAASHKFWDHYFESETEL